MITVLSILSNHHNILKFLKYSPELIHVKIIFNALWQQRITYFKKINIVHTADL